MNHSSSKQINKLSLDNCLIKSKKTSRTNLFELTIKNKSKCSPSTSRSSKPKSNCPRKNMYNKSS